ncbi:MAG: hypothetical protein A3A24_00940 [Candidatus Buchananbacteria bacterium RIFCSPLOWO2_01_FULL_46_12]|uniref:Uncharacterized protein n=1 Tax=Candidatus Buchananbacteria bacterium RIFCSPLOWO2_01_FULL_46_12 TaxID=1797546 RepID=A0A1G1YQ06_9BACT|nr:MAG: hypothetical protein A3A24_00940 [Candidatus Buchananbacteria bacterium RIFCSPLOWO2_01_FULL_46_12]
MYLTTHAAAGALIGTLIIQSPLAFLVGILSHFFLDIIPHYDGDLPLKSHNVFSLSQRHFNKIIAIILVESLLGAIVFYSLTTNSRLGLTSAMLWGITGSILPDILQVLLLVLPKNKVLIAFDGLHNFYHYRAKRPVPIVLGLLTQLIALILIVIPLINLIQTN